MSRCITQKFRPFIFNYDNEFTDETSNHSITNLLNRYYQNYFASVISERERDCYFRG